MPPAEDPVLQNLIEEEEWLRRVARSITRDPHLADDLVQNAYLAAMRSPPRDPAKRRAWLRTVVKNFARLNHRESTRRTARERATAQEEVVFSAERLVEENELRELVAQAVSQLSEPYRSTVIEHFYHGRTSTEIAQELGIPANTVRVRIRRAVGKLSATLDRRCAGQHAAWVIALLAFGLAPSQLEAFATSRLGAADRAAPAATPAGLGLPVKSLLPLAALVTLLVIVARWDSGPKDPTENATATIGSNPSRTSEHTSFVGRPRVDVVPVAPRAESPPQREVALFATVPRQVRVTNPSTGAPISGAEIFVESFAMRSERLARGRSRLEYLMLPFATERVGTTGPDGILDVDPARLARDRLLVRAPGFVEYRERERLRIREDGILPIELEPAPSASLTVRFEDGTPAARVPVTLAGAGGVLRTIETARDGSLSFTLEEPHLSAEIALDGFARVKTLARPNAEITLLRAPRHTFRITDFQKVGMPEVEVEIRLPDRRTVFALTTDEHGEFDLETNAESVTLIARHPAFPVLREEVTLAGPTPGMQFSFVEPAWIHGTVHGPAGPITDGEVIALGELPFYLRDCVRTSLREDGSFQLGPLPSGRAVTLRVEGKDPRVTGGIAPAEIEVEALVSMATNDVAIELDEGDVVTGTIVAPSGAPLPGVRLQLGAIVGDELRGPVVETDLDGVFTFVGVSPELPPVRATLKEPRWTALGPAKSLPSHGRVLQVLTPHQLLEADGEEIPRKFFLGSRNTVSVPNGRNEPLELVVAPWPRENLPQIRLEDPDGVPVRDVLNWGIYPEEDPSDVSAVFAGIDGNPVRIGDPTVLENCWITFLFENHAVSGGWFELRDPGDPWVVTVWPKLEYTIRFRHEDLSALAETQLWWVPDDPEFSGAIALGKTDATGVLVTDRLAPGRYTIVATRDETAGRPPRPFRDAIRITDGRVIGVLEIPRAERGGSSLDVRVDRMEEEGL